MIAKEYYSKFSNVHGNVDATALMRALDQDGIPADQDWEIGSTTWSFDDETKIRVEGNEVHAFGTLPNSDVEDWYFVGYSG